MALFACKLCACKGMTVEKDEEWKLKQHLESPVHGFDRAEIDRRWFEFVDCKGTGKGKGKIQPVIIRVVMNVPVQPDGTIEELVEAVRGIVNGDVVTRDKDNDMVPSNIPVQEVHTSRNNSVWLEEAVPSVGATSSTRSKPY